MKDRNIVEAIIINGKNEVLLQKKTLDYKFAPGYWAFFGGEIAEGETPEEALRRELKEEINYSVRRFTLLKVADYALPKFNIRGKRYLYKVFFDGIVSRLTLREGDGFAFFSAKEFNSVKLMDCVLEDLKHVLPAMHNYSTREGDSK